VVAKDGSVALYRFEPFFSSFLAQSFRKDFFAERAWIPASVIHEISEGVFYFSLTVLCPFSPANILFLE